jgi:ankyrin repeat protein
MHFVSLNSKLVSQKDLEESKDARDKYEVSILCVTIPLALLFAIGNILYAEKDIPKFVKSQNLKALSILIHSGLNVDKVHYRQTLTPLGYAALDDSTNVVSYLLDNGANVNQTFRHGETALMLAVQKNAVDSVRSLIAHGANLSHTRDDGKRAIDLAPTNASPELVRLLNSGSK